MRLIDADRLKEVFRRNTGHDYSELIDIQPTVDVLNKIRAEIEHEREEAYKMFGYQLGFDKIATYNKCIGIIDTYRGEP